MDPLADKLLMVSSFLMLSWYEAVPTWLTIIVLSREAVLLLGYGAILYFSEPIQVRPSAVGKVNTFLQLFTVGFALLTMARPDLPMAEVNAVTQSITAATTAASGVQYVYRGLLWQQTHPAPPS
jgi:cardiolipin synthase